MFFSCCVKLVETKGMSSCRSSICHAQFAHGYVLGHGNSLDMACIILYPLTLIVLKSLEFPLGIVVNQLIKYPHCVLKLWTSILTKFFFNESYLMRSYNLF